MLRDRTVNLLRLEADDATETDIEAAVPVSLKRTSATGTAGGRSTG